MAFSREQQEALYAMQKGRNVFISGEGGTGKSYIVREFCKNREGCVLLAPTGVAAMNIGGRTLHSFFRLPVGLLSSDTYAELLNRVDGDTDDSEKDSGIVEYLRRNLGGVKTIIIDEISMVRSDIFHFICRLLQLALQNDEPFGGIQMILTGDFYQLPPVSTCTLESDYLHAEYGGIYAFQTHAWKNGNFLHIFLKKNFCQGERGEDEFLSILRRLRRAGKHALSNPQVFQSANEAIDQLNASCCRNRQDSLADIARMSPHVICTNNETANVVNIRKLAALEGHEYFVDAQIRGRFPASEYPTQEHLCLKNHAKVMLLKNDKRWGYVNGDFGEIVAIMPGRFNCPIFRVVLERNGQIVDVKYMHSWEYTEFFAEPGTPVPKQKKVGDFKQIPIRLAYASTVHKSQGRTLDSVYVIKGKNGFFAPGQLYTALSRCRTMEHLYLFDRISLQDVIVEDAVVDFYAKME